MADKLTKNEPVKLILTYETGDVVEFNVNALTNLTLSSSGGVISRKVVNTLEITLEYDEVIKYNQLEDKKRLREAAFDLTPL